MRRKARSRARLGFTLIEVMISSALLGLGVLAGVRLFTSSVSGTSYVQDRSVATTLAVQRLERLGTQGVSALPACPGAPRGCREDRTTFTTPPACTSEIDFKYRLDTVITSHPDASRQNGARLVTVSVCWRDEQATIHQAQLDRLFVPDV
jgi:prepilin-type N-terminal cleavage/methylation domain-containing protein